MGGGYFQNQIAGYDALRRNQELFRRGASERD